MSAPIRHEYPPILPTFVLVNGEWIEVTRIQYAELLKQAQMLDEHLRARAKAIPQTS